MGRALRTASDASMPRMRAANGRGKSVLVDGRHSQGDIARRTANAARRALLRARRRLRGQPDTAEALRRAHVEAKSALKMVIKKAKKAAWDELFPSLRATAGESDAGRATANEVSDWMLEDSMTVREGRSCANDAEKNRAGAGCYPRGGAGGGDAQPGAGVARADGQVPQRRSVPQGVEGGQSGAHS